MRAAAVLTRRSVRTAVRRARSGVQQRVSKLFIVRHYPWSVSAAAGLPEEIGTDGVENPARQRGTHPDGPKDCRRERENPSSGSAVTQVSTDRRCANPVWVTAAMGEEVRVRVKGEGGGQAPQRLPRGESPSGITKPTPALFFLRSVSCDGRRRRILPHRSQLCAARPIVTSERAAAGSLLLAASADRLRRSQQVAEFARDLSRADVPFVFSLVLRPVARSAAYTPSTWSFGPAASAPARARTPAATLPQPDAALVVAACSSPSSSAKSSASSRP